MLTVVVKATFSMARDGEAELAEQQLPLSLDVRDPNGDPDGLWYPSDFVPKKPRADVTIVGFAYADPPASEIPVRIIVDVLEKQLVARAGAPTTFVPLAESHLRASSAAYAPSVAVGARRRELAMRPEAAHLLDASGLPVAPLDGGFDFGAFNSAPRDQQLSVLRANASIVLVGLTRGAAKRSVQLPGDRPRVFHVGASGPGAKPNEVSLSPDSLWIDTHTELCSVVWRGVIALAKCKEPPTQLFVTLEKRGVQRSWLEVCAAMASARRTPALEATDLAPMPEVEVGSEEITAAPDRELEQATRAGDDIVDELTPEDERAPPRPGLGLRLGLGGLGALGAPSRDTLLLDEPSTKEMEATPVHRDAAPEEEAERPTERPPPPEVEAPAARLGKETIRLTREPETTGVIDLAALQRGKALPFASTSGPAARDEEHTGAIDLAKLQASRPLPFGAPGASPAPPPAAAPAPRRHEDWSTRTMTAPVSPVAKRPATPFEAAAEPPPAVPPARASRPRDDWSTQTVAFTPGTLPSRPAVPFVGAREPEPSPPQIRAPALTSELRIDGPGAVLPFAPRPAPMASEPAPAVLVSEASVRRAVERQPERLAIETYAAVKVALWSTASAHPLALLEEHGLTEIEWMAQERRYVEAIQAEAMDDRSALAIEVAHAIAQAQKAHAPAKDELGHAEYVALQAELKAASDPAAVLEKHGLSRRALQRLGRRFGRIQ